MIKRMKLITYGCGNFDISKFKPIQNPEILNKPSGGLWSSPIDSEWGWKDWCQHEDWGDLTHSFTFTFTGNVFVIDSLKDAKSTPWIDIYLFKRRLLDFEFLVNNGYDAIHLTVNGERETRFESVYSMYGWDCETVLIMNPNKIKCQG